MAKKVAGDTYESIMRKLAEITRQVHQKSGYAFDPEMLIRHLQDATEGKFSTQTKQPAEAKLVPLSQMDNVWMSDNAKALFNGELGTVQKTESDDLKKPLNDYKIIKKYLEDRVSDSVNDLEATIAHLTSKQPNGEEGELSNNGYANIFYVRVNGEVHYVGVRWDSDDREWLVSSLRVYDNRWSAGPRVFRNCGPLDT